MDLVAAFLTGPNLAIIISSAGILTAIRSSAPAIDQHPWWARVQPFAPLVICVVLVFLPSATPLVHWGEKIILGLSLGAISTVVYKTFVQSILGRDQRINPPEPPAPTP